MGELIQPEALQANEMAEASGRVGAMDRGADGEGSK